MDALTGLVAQRAVDHALPLQPAHTGKGLGLNLDRKMAFTRAIISQMAMMFRAVVCHDQLGWGKGGDQSIAQFGFDRILGHGFSSSKTIAMWKPCL